MTSIVQQESAPQILISEIMYNPNSLEPSWEWVEIYNAGSATVDLAGWVIDDFNTVAHSGANIAAGSVAPGETAVLYNADEVSAADFEAAWGSGINLIAVTDWSVLPLSNPGDKIGLWSSFSDYQGDNQTQFNVVTSVSYSGTSDWPVVDGSGSIYLTDLSDDPNDGTNWALSTTADGEGYTSANAGGNSGADIGSPGGPLEVGTDGNDTLIGDGRNNRIFGGDGNDSINGRGGNDKLYGEMGDDTLNGNLGNDFIDGGVGNDRIEGGTGNDLIKSGSGTDNITAGAGDDIALGGSGNDRLSVGGGNDRAFGQAGNDKLLAFGDGFDVLVGGADNDQFQWRQSRDGAERDTLIGDDHRTAELFDNGVFQRTFKDFDTSLGHDTLRMWVDSVATADAIIAQIAAEYDPNGMTQLYAVQLDVGEIDEFWIRIEGVSGIYAKLDADDFAF